MRMRIQDLTSVMAPDSLARRWLGWLFAFDLGVFAIGFTMLWLVSDGLVASAHPDLLFAGDTTLTERYNHLKWLVVTLLMAGLFWRLRIPAYLGLACLYGLILVDDAGRLHEQGGRQLAYHLRLLPDLGISRSQAGELLVWALLGLLLVPVLAWAALRAPRHVWLELAPLAFAFAGLLGAAVFVDVGHDMLSARYRAQGLEEPRLVWTVMVVLENLGEAFFASMTAAVAIGLSIRHGALPAALAKSSPTP
jgi:hypothetical protein